MDREEIDLVVNAITQGFDEVIREFNKTGRAVEKSGDSASKAELMWTELNSVFSLVQQGLGYVQQGAQKVYATIKEGAALQQAEQQYRNLAESIGTTADALTNELQVATKGMVSDAELMASASQIISLGLADTKEGVGELANAISTLGLDMQQVILTFSNNSKARLDSLGLSVEGVTQRTKELEAQGFRGDAFDRAVMDMLSEKMELLGDASQTTAGQLKVLEADVRTLAEEMKVATVEAVGPYVDGIMQARDATKRLDEIEKETNDTQLKRAATIGKVAAALIALTGQTDEYGALLDEQVIKAEERHNEQTNVLTKNIGRNETAVDDLTQALREQQEAQDAIKAQELAEFYGRTADNAGEMADKVRQTAAQLDEYEASVAAAERAAADAEAANEGYITTLEDQEAAAQAAADAQRELTAATGDYFDNALGAGEETESFAMQLYNAANSAGAGAESLGILAAATGEFTDAEIEAALQAAIMRANIEELAQAVAAGEISATRAVSALQLLQDGTADNAGEAMNMAKSFGIAASDMDNATGSARDLIAELEGLPTGKTFTFTMKTDTSGWQLPPGYSEDDVRRGPGGVALAGGTGGWKEIPPGYPNDSYGPVYLSSGEKLNVIPANGSGGGEMAGGGGFTVNGPLIGTVNQQPGESSADLATRMNDDLLARFRSRGAA